MYERPRPGHILTTLATLAVISFAGVAADDKIPITTEPPEARREFLAGRDMLEQLKWASAGST